MRYDALSKYRKALMGVAALMVYYFHLGEPFLSQYSLFLKLQGHAHAQAFIGVDMFFLLSAFGLSYSFAKGNFEWKKYLGRRLWRLYPCYLVAALAMSIIDGGWSAFLKYAVFIPQITDNVYALLWYIPAILLFYLIAPIYYFYIFNRTEKKTGVTAISIGIVAVAAFMLRDVLRPDIYAVLNRLPIFFLGFLWGEWARSQRKCGVVRTVVYLGLMVIGIAHNALLNSKRIPWMMPAIDALVNIMIVPGIMVILVAIFEKIMPRLMKFGKGVMAVLGFFGGISYEFYCVHEFIMHRLKDAGAARIFPGIPVFFSCLILSILAALVLKLLFTTLPERWRASRT